MSEFDDKLSAILNDSNAMGQIMALAQSLSGPKQAGDEEERCEEPEHAEEPPEMPETPDFPAGLFDDGKDAQLLAALRPYLRAERQKKLDKALELLRLLRLLKSTRL